MAEEKKPGLQLSRRWWEQPTLDILGIREGYTAAEMGEEERWGRRNHKERVGRIGNNGGRDTEMTRRTRDNRTDILRIRHNVARNP